MAEAGVLDCGSKLDLDRCAIDVAEMGRWIFRTRSTIANATHACAKFNHSATNYYFDLEIEPAYGTGSGGAIRGSGSA